MKPHEERVVAEKLALDEKISRLSGFFCLAVFEALDDTDRQLLREQRSAMLNYSDILGERIARFEA